MFQHTFAALMRLASDLPGLRIPNEFFTLIDISFGTNCLVRHLWVMAGLGRRLYFP
jgi:hypothetical protein